MRKHNKLLIARKNYFTTGGDKNSKTVTEGDKNNKTMGLISGIGAIGTQAATDITGMINNIQSKDIEEQADSMIENSNKFQMEQQQANDSYDNLIADWTSNSRLDNVTKEDLGYKNFGQTFGEAFAAGNQGFAAGSGLGIWGSIGAATGSTASSIIGNIFRNKKAKEEAKRVNEAIAYTNNYNDRALSNRADNIATNQMQNLLANYAAFGGNLMTHGAMFNTGTTVVGNGGTHEENPYEGVPMGVDSEGVPNLVEEGEVIFNDYVFSNRLKVPKEIRKKYRLGGNKYLTFADAAIKLSKESEERPNDPISQAGLVDSMNKLMMVQELVRGDEKLNTFAKGGNLYPDGSWLQTLDYDNSTPNLTFGQEDFNPYNTDGTINWDIMYGANSPFMKRRQFVLDNWDTDAVKSWLPKYVKAVNAYNSKRKNYTSLNLDGLTKDIFANRTSDKSWGGMHAGINLIDIPTTVPESKKEVAKRKPVKRMYLTGKTDASGMPLEPELITDYDPNTGTYQWVETKSRSEGDTDYTDIYYKERPKVPATPKKSTDEEQGEYPNYDNWMRYIPLLGPATGLGMTLFTKPDDSNAQAILDASTAGGTYRPVQYKPIGNYLTYRPFDRDYYINKMNAEAGATRRNIMNTSGGNRAAAMAGILAADNNYLNQIGALGRQAEEYNRAQQAKVEDFNRATNIKNSEGLLQADMANQSAWANAREMALRGTMAAAEMREKERLTRDAAISANLSDLFNTFGDIGRERVDRSWRRWNSGKGTYAQVHAANGGKIKRRKRGLTF